MEDFILKVEAYTEQLTLSAEAAMCFSMKCFFTWKNVPETASQLLQLRAIGAMYSPVVPSTDFQLIIAVTAWEDPGRMLQKLFI